MPAPKASAIGVQYTTAYYSAIFAMNLLPGDNVLVHAAAGGVGSALIQLCKWKGCKVIGTAGSDEKCTRGLELGADHMINYREKDYARECKKILGKDRLDATFNPIAGSTFKKDLKLLGSGGRLVLFGAAERMGKKGGQWATFRFLWKMGLILPIMLMAKSRTIIGVNILKIADYRPHVISKCFTELIDLYEKGIIDPPVGGEYSIDQLAQAHDKLENRQTMGKIVVRW
ncbi:MAG: zinc-binding dehydrogenase [Flavobacteriales bacterium]|nr:zinc-binding dehydrogenase [Flavobacteriales bacterium]